MGARLPLYRQCVRPLHWHGAELARWVATGYVLAAAGSLRIINQDITLPTPKIVPEPITEAPVMNACLHHLV